jgi:hypothetical protein
MKFYVKICRKEVARPDRDSNQKKATIIIHAFDPEMIVAFRFQPWSGQWLSEYYYCQAG